jgi:hypothetical protein
MPARQDGNEGSNNSRKWEQEGRLTKMKRMICLILALCVLLTTGVFPKDASAF